MLTNPIFLISLLIEQTILPIDAILLLKKWQIDIPNSCIHVSDNKYNIGDKQTLMVLETFIKNKDDKDYVFLI
jgi:hypothetical protein